MRKLSKLLALLLAMVLVFSMVACGSDKKDDDEDDKKTSTVDTSKEDDKEEPTDEELLLGEWVCRFDMGEMMSEMMSASLGEEVAVPDVAIYMDMKFTFDEDKAVMAMVLDETSFEEYLDKLVDVLVEYTYDMAEDEGMSKEDYDAYFESEIGMSLEEYYDTLMATSLEESFDAMSVEEELYYRVDAENNRLYIEEDEDDLEDSEDYAVYTITEKELTIKTIERVDGEELEGFEEMEEYGMELPWKFEKQ